MSITTIPLRFFPLPTTRVCGTCKREKPLNRENYYERIDKPFWRPSRWHSHCIGCTKARAAEAYREDINGSRETRRRQYKTKKQNRVNLHHIPLHVQRASQAARIARRLEDIDRRHRKALIRDSLGPTGTKSFSQQAVARRIAEGAARALAGMEVAGTTVDPYADPTREAASAIWRNDSLKALEKIEALRALATTRSRWRTDDKQNT